MATKKAKDDGSVYTFGTYVDGVPNLATQMFGSEAAAADAAAEDFDDEMWGGFTVFKLTPVGSYDLNIVAVKQ